MLLSFGIRMMRTMGAEVCFSFPVMDVSAGGYQFGLKLTKVKNGIRPKFQLQPGQNEALRRNRARPSIWDRLQDGD